jgi:hypothetical protein
MKTIICDIDGTVAHLVHRLHYIRCNPKNYDAFYAGVINDVPIQPVIELLKSLNHQEINIILVSGRPETTRTDTEKWLSINQVPYSKLLMRKENDRRQDNIVKKEILQNILEEGHTILFAIEDRKQVKQMWVENNVFVFDVNQKDVVF